MKCWTRPNHLRTLVQPGTRPGLFWFLAWARSAVHVCTSISITKVWERAKNKRVRSWSLSKAMGEAALVEEQLGQLWWKGQCGVAVQVLLGSAQPGWCSEELLPSSAQAELCVWCSGMALKAQHAAAPGPCWASLQGKGEEGRMKCCWRVCECVKLCICMYTHVV